MPLANTGTLQTNFNVNPYYDDYKEDKNFHRILFKPGLAVQARELTQLQTILQNQIDRFGEHIFKEGSVVRGNAVSVDDKVQWVRLLNEQDNITVDVSDFAGTEITGGTSGLVAVVVDTAEGLEETLPDTKTLFVKPISAGSNSTVRFFRPGEVITSNTGIQATLLAANSVGYGYRVIIDDGIIFAKDHFIRADRQSIIASKYTNTPTVRVGYKIDEEIVTFVDDNTLLDPAQGAYNYAAPGADRLKLVPNITVLVSNTALDPDDFIERVVIEGGFLKEKYDKTVYNVIRDYMAQRTYDESGDYIVQGLDVNISEHYSNTSLGNGGVWNNTYEGANTALLAAGVYPGKAYVQGYDLEILKTVYTDVEKGIDTNTLTSTTQYASLGNYVKVNELVGDWNYDQHMKVLLHGVEANAVTSQSGSGTLPPAAYPDVIGTAKVRALEWESGVKGSADAEYRLYLYDVVMSSNSFAYVRSIANTTTTPSSYADVVLQNGIAGDSNTAVLENTNLNSYIINLPSENLITDTTAWLGSDTAALNNVKYETKRFLSNPNWQSSDGLVTVATLSGVSYLDTSGAISASGARERYQFTVDSEVSAKYPLDTGATRTASANTFVLTADPSTFLNKGDYIIIDGEVGANNYLVTGFRSGNKVDVSGPGRNRGDSGTLTIRKNFLAGQVIPIADDTGYAVGGNTTSASDRSMSSSDPKNPPTIDLVDIPNTDTNMTVTAVVSRDSPITATAKTLSVNRYVKLSLATHGTTGPFPLGYPDVYKIKNVYLKDTDFSGNAEDISNTRNVTRYFRLLNRQNNNFYGTSKMELLPGLTLTGTQYLMVQFDYFTRASTGGFFSVDSYPIDDISPSATQIRSENLPNYINSSGNEILLRDVIDFRPYTSNTVASVDNSSPPHAVPFPGVSDNIDVNGSLDSIHPDRIFTSDITYNLPRKDLLILNRNGIPTIIRGVSDLNPITPRHNMDDGLLLATIEIPAYPSMSPFYASVLRKVDESVKVKQNRQVRFTMRDIGTLKQRIENIEYYTSLNMLEKSLKDLQISDSSGLNRFKNGFFVDPLRGHSYADVNNRDHTVAIDKINNELIPAEFNYDIPLEIDGSSQTKQAGDFIFIDYFEVLIQNQPKATTSTLVSSLSYQYNGTLVLSPPSDYFHDVKFSPRRNINLDSGMGAALTSISRGLNQIGRSTELLGTGISLSSEQQSATVNLTVEQELLYEQTTTDSKVTRGMASSKTIGTSIVDTSLVPYMRSKVIRFKATGMKPGARLAPYFDGRPVWSHVYQTDTNYVKLSSPPFPQGQGVKVAASTNDIATGYQSGDVYGIFIIPQATFPVGTSAFSLSDNTSKSSSQDATTFASANFSSHGLSSVKQTTSISTVPYDIDIDVNKTSIISKTSDSQQIYIPPPIINNNITNVSNEYTTINEYVTNQEINNEYNQYVTNEYITQVTENVYPTEVIQITNNIWEADQGNDYDHGGDGPGNDASL